eukprot:CAMPEP_0168524416 /NCGR_PEP_ID=MMETSP0405-20121227/10634_1 /TAXON_ID=498012 /ORGANISM="Trichosphaerium sp, Strain Am-I-7 wt" /LENGTH=491 /DNA_ID=CAMNT_0008546613 /DNA_START=20 /DNA_END=1495 /DNA_ORIENTATION=-
MGCLVGGEKKPLNLDPINIGLDHFDRLRVIGKGAFGKVHAVQRRDTKKLYAMKCLEKRKIMNQKMVKNVLNETYLLTKINYPLIVNLRFALQSPYDLYMVVDLMQGGDVRFHYRHDKKFSKTRTCFYVVQTALSLNYLHENGYMHRDIKPDNLLFDSDGNCHLTDFNLSVKLAPNGIKGVAGTRPYMAPEVMNRQRYDERADWWSLGVLAYELYCGRLPFSGSNFEDLKANVQKTHPSYPRNIDPNFKAVLVGLLQKNPARRFGFKELKKHACFKHLDWSALENKIAEAPWKPDPKRAHVDGSYDLDEQFEPKSKKHKYPLSEEEQEQFKDWDYNWKKSKIKRFNESESEEEEPADDEAIETKIPSKTNTDEGSAESGESGGAAETKDEESSKEANGVKPEESEAAEAKEETQPSPESSDQPKADLRKSKAAKKDVVNEEKGTKNRNSQGKTSKSNDVMESAKQKKRSKKRKSRRRLVGDDVDSTKAIAGD